MKQFKIRDYLPEFYKTSGLMAAIETAVMNEFTRLQAVVGAMCNEGVAASCNEYIEEWERSVGLLPSPQLTLTERRSRVLSRRRQVGTTTPERVTAIIHSYSRSNCEIFEDYKNYTVVITFTNNIGRPDNIDGIITQLKRIIPAHLALEYIYPYRLWQQVEEEISVWEGADAYSWSDLMEEEI